MMMATNSTPDGPHRVAARFRVSGVVQGVGFRWWVRRNADRLGLSGWVMNADDERAVELVAEGKQTPIGEVNTHYERLLIEALRLKPERVGHLLRLQKAPELLGQLVQQRRARAGARSDSGFRLLDSVDTAFTSRLALVDAGWDTDTAWGALLDGIRTTGHQISDVTAVVATHAA